MDGDLRRRILNFQSCFLRARVVVECSLGQMKQRFCVLKDGLRLRSPELAGKLVQVVAMMHNNCNMFNDNMEDLDLDESSASLDDDAGNSTLYTQDDLLPPSSNPTRMIILDKYFR